MDKSTSEQALNAIVDLIIQHVYHPGDRLFETTLAEKLNISRTPVRAALTQLVTCGFLEKIPKHRGYLVPVLMPGDMQLVFQTRGLLEGALSAQAAMNRTAEEVAVLKSISEREGIAFDSGDRKEYADCNEKFHLSIAAFARNPYLESCLTHVFWRSRLYDFFFSGFYNKPLTHTQKNTKRTWNEHAGIIEAIASQDSTKAEELMKKHIVSTYEDLFRKSE